MAFGRFVFLLITASAVFIGYQINTIYVSPNFERPLTYKFNCFLVKIALVYANLKSYFTFIEPVTIFRELADKQTDKYQPASDLDVSSEFLNGNEIRAFRSRRVGDALLPTIIFYHGGGYVFGSIDRYVNTIEYLTRSLTVNIIAVRYRFAPENPYPIPVNDCMESTDYIIENYERFKVDTKRIAFMGDSAGGGIAAVLTQRYSLANKPYPKCQVLIYPWLQAFNFKLPSFIQYRNNARIFSITQYAHLHFGFTGDDGAEMNNILMNNEHVLALENQNQIRKYDSYLNVDLIPEKYRLNKQVYAAYEKLKSQNQIFPFDKLLERNSFLDRNKKLVKEMFSIEMSPVLAEDDQLSKLPKTYIVALEWDVLRDEALIYSSRLRMNKVDVELDFYEDAFHGIIALSDPEYKIAKIIRYNIKDYLSRNLLDSI